jgi:uncharacterized membrane protein YtjA (UPF0391 family)
MIMSYGKRRPSRAIRFPPAGASKGVHVMLYYTLVFLVVALIAGALGFGGVASASASIARILFALFLVLFLVSLVSQFLGKA